MTPDAGNWCPYGAHRLDQGRNLCPVCTDRARRDAEAAAVVLFGRVAGSGGRA